MSDTIETLETFETLNGEDLYVMAQEYEEAEKARIARGQTEQEDELRTALGQVLRKEGKSEAEIEAALASYDREIAINHNLEDAGLKVNSRRHLVKMTKVQMRGGRLHDGILHYQWQTVVSGSGTYNYREALKDAGFRWDPADKVWTKAMTNGSIADNLKDARYMLNDAIGWEIRQERLDDAASDFGPAAE